MACGVLVCMRVYLDNCCYNRPFDEQTQLKVRLETEAKMEIQTLVKAFGDVNAERVIVLTNRDPQDYTRWRETNMYIGESVHDVAERARAAAARYQSLNAERV